MYNAFTMRCGGRSITAVPIIVGLIVLIVLYSLSSRTSLSTEDVTEPRRGSPGNKRLLVHERDREDAGRISKTFQKERQPKERTEEQMALTTLEVFGEVDSSTFVYSSQASAADPTTTTPAFPEKHSTKIADNLKELSTKVAKTLDKPSTKVAKINSDLTAKVISDGKQSAKNKTRESNLNCEKIITKYRNYKITDERLLDISTRCLDRMQTQPPVGAELFRRLFVEQVFQSIECREPVVTVNNGPALPVIALASFPGSGNTWTRVLLDQMNGIYTGSVFTDGMSNKILKGSLKCPYSKVFIIKTHKTGNGTSGKCGVRKLDYESAIYILRNPYNAIIAEFNREHAGKVAIATESMFKSPAWEKAARGFTNGWTTHVQYWLSTFKKPVHVLVYEDLVQDTLWELYRISKFVSYRATFETMWCIQKRQTDQAAFKRKKPDWLKAEKLFSKRQKTDINKHIKDLIDQLPKHPEIKTRLQSYILNA